VHEIRGGVHVVPHALVAPDYFQATSIHQSTDRVGELGALNLFTGYKKVVEEHRSGRVETAVHQVEVYKLSAHGLHDAGLLFKLYRRVRIEHRAEALVPKTQDLAHGYG